MARVSAKDFQKEFGSYRNKAQKEAVFVTHYGRADCVLLSYERYQELVRKAYGFAASLSCDEEFTEEEAQALIDG